MESVHVYRTCAVWKVYMCIGPVLYGKCTCVYMYDLCCMESVHVYSTCAVWKVYMCIGPVLYGKCICTFV